MQTIISIAIPILKALIGAYTKKKMSDEEFVQFILAHQRHKSNAGEAALTFEEQLEKARQEMKK